MPHSFPRYRRLLAIAAAGLSLTLLAAGSAGAAAPLNPGHAFGHSHKKVCGAAPLGYARCHSDVVTDAAGDPLATSGPDGYGPPDLQSAYNIGNEAASAGGTQTIGIVDAFDDPNAEKDLAVYRQQFGLPPCTTANGCFRKVDQDGGTTYPKANAGWAEEISLDLDMASAICPNCKLLLVETDDNLLNNLAVGVDRAATMGATQISNSYGGSEYKGETTDESHYNHAGVAITVSSGDSGYGAEFPAASRYVTSVGGTSLNPAAGTARGWTETAWSGAGSGCSAYVTKPSWQIDASCSRRTIADVAAVADPNTGVAVYDTYNDPGWLVFGGTSAAAPIVAAFDALVGSPAGNPSYPYGTGAPHYDVTSGNNGKCGGTYLCNSGPCFDGPTGLGTPHGATGSPPNQTPCASLKFSPAAPQTGQSVTFDGSASRDPDGPIADYSWDFDGDGVYETDTGTTPSASHSYSSAQTITVRLRVKDAAGATNVATQTLTVTGTTVSNSPPVAQLAVTPNPAQSGETVTFDGSKSTDSDGTILDYTWDLDGDGSYETDTKTSPLASRSYPTARTITVRLRVEDNDGATGTATDSLVVQEPPAPNTTSGGGGGATTTTTTTTTTPTTTAPGPIALADTVRPALSSYGLSPRSFRAARSGPSASTAAVSTGTRVTFALSERATVTFQVERAVSGRLVGGRCVPVTRANRGARRCTRYRLLSGRFTRAGAAGRNAFRFTGRLLGHRLTRGRYRLDALAVDPAGNRGLLRRTTFTIV
jgi:hypothetical protein